jgi:uroporphyrin-III C-methyltransferase
VAIVENATRANERVIITTVGDLAATIAHEAVQSPALFIVGEVVRTYVPRAAEMKEDA